MPHLSLKECLLHVLFPIEFFRRNTEQNSISWYVQFHAVSWEHPRLLKMPLRFNGTFNSFFCHDRVDATSRNHAGETRVISVNSYITDVQFGILFVWLRSLFIILRMKKGWLWWSRLMQSLLGGLYWK